MALSLCISIISHRQQQVVFSDSQLKMSTTLKICALEKGNLESPEVVYYFIKFEVCMLLIRGSQANTSVSRYQELTIMQPCPILLSDMQQLASLSFWPV